MCARLRPMSPYAYDYGAGGAALFDIVNVQTGRGARYGALTRLLPSGGGVAILLSIFASAGLARRPEHSPRKRAAEGSSPSASTAVSGRNRPVAATALIRRSLVSSAVAAPSIRLAMRSWRNGRRSRLRSGRPRGMEVQVLPGAPYSRVSLAGKAPARFAGDPAVLVREEAPTSLP